MSKPDLSQYPEIPQGCLINENKTFGLFQIYRNISIKDPITGKVKHTRETIGSIKNGIFTFSKTYLLAEQNRELSSKIDSMSAVNQVTLETNLQIILFRDQFFFFSPDQFSTLSRSSDLLHSDY